MKFKIVEIDDNGVKKFKIQKRKFFFWTDVGFFWIDKFRPYIFDEEVAAKHTLAMWEQK